MKTQVYSFRAAPGTVPAGMSAGDYVKSLGKGGAITAGSMVDTGSRLAVNIFFLLMVITIIAQWVTITKLKKKINA